MVRKISYVWIACTRSLTLVGSHDRRVDPTYCEKRHWWHTTVASCAQFYNWSKLKTAKEKNKAAQLWIRLSQSLFSSVLLNPLPVFHGNFITILFRDRIGRMEWLLFHQALKNCHHHRLSFSLHPKVSPFSISNSFFSFFLSFFLYLISN